MTQTFVKIGNLVFPKERIGKINLEAIKPGTNEPIITVQLHGMETPFEIDGQLASQAFNLLQDVKPSLFPPINPGVRVLVGGVDICASSYTTMEGIRYPLNFEINGEIYNAADVEWADLETNFGADGVGVEMRIATDPIGQSRIFLGNELADEAYDVIVGLINEGNAVPLVKYA